MAISRCSCQLKDSLYLGKMSIDIAFENQENGLCGAGQKEKLFLIAGIQNGTIQIDVKFHDSRPDIDESFEDIVECNFTVGKYPIFLCEWGHENIYALNLPLSNYIVRYNISGMDLDYDEEEDYEKPIPEQKHLLQFWKANSIDDKIIKTTSKVAKYWHDNVMRK